MALVQLHLRDCSDAIPLPLRFTSSVGDHVLDKTTQALVPLEGDNEVLFFEGPNGTTAQLTISELPTEAEQAVALAFEDPVTRAPTGLSATISFSAHTPALEGYASDPQAPSPSKASPTKASSPVSAAASSPLPPSDPSDAPASERGLSMEPPVAAHSPGGIKAGGGAPVGAMAAASLGASSPSKSASQAAQLTRAAAADPPLDTEEAAQKVSVGVGDESPPYPAGVSTAHAEFPREKPNPAGLKVGTTLDDATADVYAAAAMTGGRGQTLSNALQQRDAAAAAMLAGTIKGPKGAGGVTMAPPTREGTSMAPREGAGGWGAAADRSYAEALDAVGGNSEAARQSLRGTTVQNDELAEYAAAIEAAHQPIPPPQIAPPSGVGVVSVSKLGTMLTGPRDLKVAAPPPLHTIVRGVGWLGADRTIPSGGLVPAAELRPEDLVDYAVSAAVGDHSLVSFGGKLYSFGADAVGQGATGTLRRRGPPRLRRRDGFDVFRVDPSVDTTADVAADVRVAAEAPRKYASKADDGSEGDIAEEDEKAYGTAEGGGEQADYEPVEVPLGDNCELRQFAIGSSFSFIHTSEAVMFCGLIGGRGLVYPPLQCPDLTPMEFFAHTEANASKHRTPDDVLFITSHDSAMHALIVTVDSVFAMGANDHGELGIGHRTPFTVPQHISLFNAVPVQCASAGQHFSLVLAENILYSWGYGPSTGLGTRSDVLDPQPIEFFGSSNRVALMSSGRQSTLVLAEKGLYHFGLAVGRTNIFQLTPRRVEWFTTSGKVNDIVALAVGSHQYLVQCGINEIFVFGRGHHGEMGLDGDVLTTTVPTRISTFVLKPHVVTQIAAGNAITAVVQDNAVYTFGDPFSGRLGYPPPPVGMPGVLATASGTTAGAVARPLRVPLFHYLRYPDERPSAAPLQITARGAGEDGRRSKSPSPAKGGARGAMAKSRGARVANVPKYAAVDVQHGGAAAAASARAKSRGKKVKAAEAVVVSTQHAVAAAEALLQLDGVNDPHAPPPPSAGDGDGDLDGEVEGAVVAVADVGAAAPAPAAEVPAAVDAVAAAAVADAAVAPPVAVVSGDPGAEGGVVGVDETPAEAEVDTIAFTDGVEERADDAAPPPVEAVA